MGLRNFYEKTTKVFKIELKYNGITPDLVNDTVSIIFKKRKGDLDSIAVLVKDADVVAEGINGIAIFTLTPEETTLDPGTYFYEIKWITVDSYNIVESNKVEVLDRIYD